MTYLHYAAVYKNAAVCELLLRYGANPLLRTFAGYGYYDDAKSADGTGPTAEEIFPKIKEIRLKLDKIAVLGPKMLNNKQFCNVVFKF